ncbi:TPA: hypothetical protein ACE8FC_001450 [Neisseria gonorrhoeae]
MPSEAFRRHFVQESQKRKTKKNTSASTPAQTASMNPNRPSHTVNRVFAFVFDGGGVVFFGLFGHFVLNRKSWKRA